MTKIRLKQGIRSVNESEKLSDAQWEQLSKLVNQAALQHTKPEDSALDNAKPLSTPVALTATTTPRFTRRKFLFGVASAACVAGVSLVVSPLWQTSQDHSDAIVKEVLYNHFVIKEVDVTAASLQALRGQFAKIDFVPVISKHFPEQLYQLEGARYCSLRGIKAIQFVFKTPTEERVTLYQAVYDASHFGPLPQVERGDMPRTLTARGSDVTFWVEHGVVLAFARPHS